MVSLRGPYWVQYCLMSSPVTQRDRVHPQQVCWQYQAEWCSWHTRRTGCHPKRPGQAQEVGPCEPHKVQHGQAQGPVHGSAQALVSIQAGGWRAWEQPCQDWLGGTGGWKDGHEATMCARSPEGQPYPGLHQEKRGQQIEGGDSAPLLHSGETPPGVLHPALEPSAQEGHGAVGAGPVEGYKNDQRAPLLWGKAERVGAVQSGEEKAARRPYCGLLVVKGSLEDRWGQTF